MNGTWEEVLELCRRFADVTYENLTKIVRYEQAGSAARARDLDDCFENDLDSWMGGGTCFSMTWFVYRELLALGLAPRLLMGHKRKERNVHCALLVAFEGGEFLFDPGYLIFEPLELPKLLPLSTLPSEACFPLVPNAVKLVRRRGSLELWTGYAGQMKLRFEFDLAGVSEAEFKVHWSESFGREMMTYPVLNKLDRERGIQYYFQKGNLMIRSGMGSTMRQIARAEQPKILHEIFGIDEALAEKALRIVERRNQ